MRCVGNWHGRRGAPRLVSVLGGLQSLGRRERNPPPLVVRLLSQSARRRHDGACAANTSVCATKTMGQIAASIVKSVVTFQCFTSAPLDRSWASAGMADASILGNSVFVISLPRDIIVTSHSCSNSNSGRYCGIE